MAEAEAALGGVHRRADTGPGARLRGPPLPAAPPLALHAVPQPHPHRRLRLRSGARAARQIPFDPVVAELERRLEDREWERLAAEGLHAPGMEAAPVPEDLADGGAEEDYLNDAVRFNVTRRVEALFPKIDVDPADGLVTGAELAAWNLASTRREVLHRTARELDLHDRDHDGRVAFSEYERPSWAWRFDDSWATL